MYPRLPLKFIGITDVFGMRKHPITGVSTFHYGLDLGWNRYQGEPVYASYDATVVDEGYNSSLGNYVVLKYKIQNKTIINRYLHLKNRAIVKKGSKVNQNEIIGYMGKTGSAVGVHLHFEYWICPDNYSYRSSDYVKYAVDPLKHCYLYEGQEVSSSSISNVKKVVGVPIKKNSKKSQIRVVLKYVNCRSTPSLDGKILGYINLGYYNVLDSRKKDGYTWYKVGNNRWVAYLKNAVVRYFVLQNENNVVDNSDAQDNVSDVIDNDNSSEIEDNINNENCGDKINVLDDFMKFEAVKDDYYYIYLKKGEAIYYPK